jgi:predicted SprT family Zn-dependent metalloprotease
MAVAATTTRKSKPAILKYLVVIALAGLLLWLLFRKLRPYLVTLRNFIQAIRRFQAQASQTRNHSEAEKLICCAACGVWVPQTRALAAVGSRKSWYCSDECRDRKRKAAR